PGGGAVRAARRHPPRLQHQQGVFVPDAATRTATAHRVSDAVATYLPELTADGPRERLYEMLPEWEEGDSPRATADEFPPPPSYTPEEDREGRFHDYCAHFVRLWSGPAADAAASPQAARSNTILEDFVAGQCTAVAGLVLRTLLEELHHRRANGGLHGDTPEERYRSFRAWTNSPEGHARLLERYPHLFHTLRARVSAAAHYLARVVAEVERERPRLDDAMPGVAPGTRITAVALGEGDTHGGSSVARIGFSGGGQVVYKPHPMEAEAGFNDAVAWFNDRLDLELPTVCVLPTSDGGFAEYITADGHPEPERYFTLVGRLLGVLHLVKATDIHFENVVTSTRGPVVVDAETLFTPRRSAALGGQDETGAWGRALGILMDSVAGIGVLPMVMKSDPADRGLDVGVIGYDQGQPVPYKALQIDNPGRDDMAARLVRLHATNASTNLSVSRAADTPARVQRDIIKHELHRVLTYASAHRRDVAAALQNRLGSARFRFIAAPTYFYSQLLRMATHPDAVSDRLTRAAVLHRGLLRHGSVELAADEARQMEKGDVPYFCYTPESRSLYSADGRTVLADAFARTPLEAVTERIAGLDDAAIATQLRMVDFAFVNKLPADREPTGFTLHPRPGAPSRIGQDRLMAEASRVGDLILETMVEGADPDTPAAPIPAAPVRGGCAAARARGPAGHLGVGVVHGPRRRAPRIRRDPGPGRQPVQRPPLAHLRGAAGPR
ncbi:type 2 lanthipeptide synthetase LanM, partial [Streptomonospora algeriensis]